jgi:hypothetical protein
MTEEMKKKLNTIKYKSMIDFSKQIDEIKNMDDKLAFAVEYLLSHTENVDCALDEAIEIARMKIADGVAEYKKMAKEAILAEESKKAFPDLEAREVDLKPYGNVLNNKHLDEFLAYPSLYLRKIGNHRVQELKNKLENEDMTLKDQTGIIFLDYNQPLFIINKIFALFKNNKMSGKTIKVKGWYRRSPVPYVEIKTYEVDGQEKKIFTYPLGLALRFMAIALEIAGTIALFVL